MKLEERLVNSIVLYDYNKDHIDLKAYFEFILHLCKSLGLEPDYMGTSYSRKMLLFKNGLRTLEKKGFEGVEDICVSAPYPESEYSSLDYAAFFTSIIKKEKVRNQYMGIAETVQPFAYDFYEKLIADQWAYCDFNYAICYPRSHKYGPYWYAGGIGYGDTSDLEDDWIANWGSQYSLAFKEVDPETDYRTGLLRDIYPLNVITDVHLEQRILGTTLRQWIEKSPHHGTLHPLTPKHTSWRVAEEDLERVKQELIPSRILLAHNHDWRHHSTTVLR